MAAATSAGGGGGEGGAAEAGRRAGEQASGETQGSGVPHRDESEAEIRVE